MPKKVRIIKKCCKKITILLYHNSRWIVTDNAGKTGYLTGQGLCRVSGLYYFNEQSFRLMKQKEKRERRKR